MYRRISESNTIADYLKEHGYNRTKVTVRKKGDAYYCTIKDINIEEKTIIDLVKRFEKIRYDEYSGEILSGGNTYVFVDYDDKLIDKIYDKYGDKALKAIKSALKNLGHYVSVGDGLEIAYPIDPKLERLDADDVHLGTAYGRGTLANNYLMKYKGKEKDLNSGLNDELPILMAKLGIGENINESSSNMVELLKNAIESFNFTNLAKIYDVWDKLADACVPTKGKADTVGGEIIRAISRIMYRRCNDGDYIGIDYGNITCNAPARYLMEIIKDRRVINTIKDMWGEYYSIPYMHHLASLICKYLIKNIELFEKPNHDDMLDWHTYEDEHSDDDEEDDY